MPKPKQSLNELLDDVRRIQESRVVLTEKKIKALYQQLVKELNTVTGEVYIKYAGEDGALTAAMLQQHAKMAWFLNEINNNCAEFIPATSAEIRKIVDSVYKNCFNSLVTAVKASYNLSDLNVRPEVMKETVDNNIEKLTLPPLLEKNRHEIVYEIRQTITIGLMNGDRYETMARRLSERINISYGKAINITRTETHRNIEGGFMDAAKVTQNALSCSGLIEIATWHSMEDERVRPQRRYHTKTGWKTKISGTANHIKMNGVSIRVGDKFKLEPDVYAECPGKSGTARNDCRCRCFLEYDLVTPEEWEKLENKQENFLPPLKAGKNFANTEKNYANAEKRSARTKTTPTVGSRTDTEDFNPTLVNVGVIDLNGNRTGSPAQYQAEKFHMKSY